MKFGTVYKGVWHSLQRVSAQFTWRDLKFFLKKIFQKSEIRRSLQRGSTQFVNARQRVKSRPRLLLCPVHLEVKIGQKTQIA